MSKEDENGGILIVIIGSSAGRGSRAAAWMQDYINKQGGSNLQSYALEGGIKGWVKTGGKLLGLMDGYEESVWNKE